MQRRGSSVCAATAAASLLSRRGRRRRCSGGSDSLTATTRDASQGRADLGLNVIAVSLLRATIYDLTTKGLRDAWIDLKTGSLGDCRPKNVAISVRVRLAIDGVQASSEGGAVYDGLATIRIAVLACGHRRRRPIDGGHAQHDAQRQSRGDCECTSCVLCLHVLGGSAFVWLFVVVCVFTHQPLYAPAVVSSSPSFPLWRLCMMMHLSPRKALDLRCAWRRGVGRGGQSGSRGVWTGFNGVYLQRRNCATRDRRRRQDSNGGIDTRRTVASPRRASSLAAEEECDSVLARCGGTKREKQQTRIAQPSCLPFASPATWRQCRHGNLGFQ